MRKIHHLLNVKRNFTQLLILLMGLIVSGCTITAELKEKLSSLLDNKSPEVVLSSVVQGYSNQPSWLVDLHSSEELLNLEASDLIVVNGVIGSLSQVSEKHWQLQVHPSVDGLVTIHLPDNTAEGRYTAKANLASNQISIVSDRTKPGVTLGYLGADPTNISPIVVNVIFDEDLQTAPDLAHFQVTNGAAGNLTGSGRVFTVEITPSSASATISVEYLAGQVLDLAGNSNDVSNLVTVAFNSNRPVPTLSSSAAAAVNTAAITVNVSFSDGVTGFDVSDLEVTNAAVSGFSGSGDSYSFTLTALSPGTFNVKVKDSAAQDGSTNPSLASNVLSRIYDIATPTITLSKTESSPTTQQSLVVTVVASEAISGLALTDFVLSNATVSSLVGSGTTYTLTVTATGQGAVDIQLPAGAVTDVAGNASTASNTLSWYYDLFAPSLTITSVQSSPTNVSPLVIQFEASEVIAGFASSDIAVTNGTLANFSSVDGTHWTAEVTPTANGNVVISVAAGSFQDGAGKDNAVSALTVSYDGTRPTVTLSGLTAYSNTSPKTVTVTFSESVSGLTLTDFVFVNATATLSGSGSVYSLIVTPTSEGLFSVAASEHAASDAAGNTSEQSNTHSSTYDITPPTAVIVSDAGYYNFDAPIPLTVTFSEPVTGVAASDFTVSGGNLSGLAGSGAIYTMNFTPTGAPATGVKTVFLKSAMVQDLAGNTNAVVSSTEQFYYDNTPVTISLAQKDQVVAENDGALKNITFNLSVAKPYGVDVFYRTLGTAVSGVDHDIPTSGFVHIPAGSTSVDLPFQVSANGASLESKYTQVNLYYASTPAAVFSNQYQSRVLVQDVDSGARAIAAQVVVSNENRCLLTTAGKLKCWGANSYGQIGDGTTTVRDLPVDVDAATSYSEISLGYRHACGLSVGGDVKCWGYNSNSQLGDGLTAARSIPFTVASGYTKISAGDDITCGIKSGDVYCWGSNSSGQMGVGTTGGTRATPALTLDQVADFTDVTAGSNYACAINTNKELYCWGHNGSGQLGDGTKDTRTLPVLIGTGFMKVRAQPAAYVSKSTCALKDDKFIYCWGGNSNGIVGDGTTTERLVPTVTFGGYEFDDVSVGTLHACGRLLGGGLRCWGSNTYNWNSLGGLGNGVYITNTSTSKPELVLGGDAFGSMSAGWNATCGVTSLGRVKCWGDFNRGYMTDPAGHIRLVPEVSDLGETYSRMATGPGGICGITAAGLLKCWGGWDGYDPATNTHSIGDGTNILRTSPVIIDRGRQYTDVSSAGRYSCGIRDTGFLYCWGKINSGANEIRPVKVDGTVKYQSVSVGGSHSCGITTTNVLKCWGTSSNGSVGAGVTNTTYATPVVIDSGVTYAKVALAGSNTCGITTTGVLKCWGYNYYGAVGVGDAVYSYNLPQVVMNGTKFVDVSLGGGDSVCAISEAKDLYCWGKGDYYRLGVGNTSNYTAPQLVASGTKFDAVMAGANAGCAIRTSDKRVMCWGSNSPYGVLTGVLGNNNASATTPQLTADGDGYVSLGAPGVAACGVTVNQVLKCWGNNRYGGSANDSVFRMWGTPIDVTTWVLP